MGYYSDAALCLRESDFKGLLAEAKTIDKSVYNDLAKHTSITVIDTLIDGDKVLCVRWDGVKWYEEFPSIQLIENWMDGDSGCHPFKFVRLGEEYEDIEIRQSDGFEFDEYIYPIRYIENDGGPSSCRYVISEETEEDVCPVSEPDRDSIFDLLM